MKKKVTVTCIAETAEDINQLYSGTVNKQQWCKVYNSLHLISYSLFSLYHPSASDHEALLLSLNKQLLRSVDTKDTLPNPSVHIALRLSTNHNLAKESEYLNRLKAEFHDDIEKYRTHITSFPFNFKTIVNYFRNNCHVPGSVVYSDLFYSRIF